MASTSVTPTASLAGAQPTGSAQGVIVLADAGITGGYTGDNLTIKVLIVFFIGLALYNTLELVTLIIFTFKKYRGIYFWSLMTAGFGVIPYELGFLLKYYQLVNNSSNQTYVAISLCSVGWYAMITGQSLVLWSRLHLVVQNRRILRCTLFMIIANAILMYIPTSVLTYGSNSNNFSEGVLARIANGYNIMEKIQMTVFFLQETVLSLIYIKETVRLLKLSKLIKDENLHSKRIMYQLIAINILTIILDSGLVAVELAGLYIIQTTLKGVIYSIKLKLEFAVLSRLILIVKKPSSSNRGGGKGPLQTQSNESSQLGLPDYVNPGYFPDDTSSATVMPSPPPTAILHMMEPSWMMRPAKIEKGSWIDEEMARYNIV